MIPARFHPEAVAGFAEASEFYEAVEPGLGLAFTQDVERTVDRICAFPESGATLGSVAGRSTRSLAAMTEPLPDFRYHPDPIATGVVKESSTVCACCGKARGFVYVAHVYSTRGAELDGRLCPWCIADGTAAREFSATFNCDVGGSCIRFVQTGPKSFECVDTEWEAVPDSITKEIEEQTPGFSSYQDPKWWTHCGDGAAFIGYVGELPPSIFSGPEALDFCRAIREQWELSESDWQWYTTSPDEEHGFTTYVFRCLHCQKLGGFADSG